MTLLYGRGFRLIEGEYEIGELGLFGSVVRMGGNGGRALEDGEGLVKPEDGESELARLTCGFICAAECYIRAVRRAAQPRPWDVGEKFTNRGRSSHGRQCGRVESGPPRCSAWYNSPGVRLREWRTKRVD